jgi:hypothetical protein
MSKIFRCNTPTNHNGSCSSTISPENIEGARAYGLNAVHVTSSGDVAQALAALGI